MLIFLGAVGDLGPGRGHGRMQPERRCASSAAAGQGWAYGSFLASSSFLLLAWGSGGAWILGWFLVVLVILREFLLLKDMDSWLQSPPAYGSWVRILLRVLHSTRAW